MLIRLTGALRSRFGRLMRQARSADPHEALRIFQLNRGMRRLLAGKTGLEIGGPSPIFTATGDLPVYPWTERVDNTNFSQVTIWEGTIQEGMTFKYDDNRPPGRQYFCDATDLKPVASDTYDFLLTSHTLEHVANPLRALGEFLRVVKPGGSLVVILPHLTGTFDHRRDVTPLEHMIDDFQRDVQHDDLTHLEEIIAKHDLTMDPEAGDLAAFRRRSLDNPTNRCLHHHCFDAGSAVQLLDHAGIQLTKVEVIRPYHIVMIGRKPYAGTTRDNRAFTRRNAGYRRSSPFTRDRSGSPA